MRIGRVTSTCFSKDPDQRDGFGTSDGTWNQDSKFVSLTEVSSWRALRLQSFFSTGAQPSSPVSSAEQENFAETDVAALFASRYAALFVSRYAALFLERQIKRSQGDAPHVLCGRGL